MRVPLSHRVGSGKELQVGTKANRKGACGISVLGFESRFRLLVNYAILKHIYRSDMHFRMNCTETKR